MIAPDAADSTCTSIGNTDGNGEIEIPTEYDGYTVVATIVAGQTKDSDNVDYAPTSYEMRSTDNHQHGYG